MRAHWIGSFGLVLGLGCGDGSGDAATGADEGESGARLDLPTPTDDGSDTGDPPLECNPGTTRCALEGEAVESCAPDGQGWEAAPCGAYQSCVEARCLGPCELAGLEPSSAGCSFLGARLFHGLDADLEPEPSDAIIVGNPSDEVATVQLYHVPVGSLIERAVGDPVTLAPGDTHVFAAGDPLMADADGPLRSGLQSGGLYRVASDFPLVAYQQASRVGNARANDASMLLPEDVLNDLYVIASYPPFQAGFSGEPSFFTVIALEDGTTVSWTPPVDTWGDGFPVDAVAAGSTGTALLNRYDMLQVGASPDADPDVSTWDLSGTVVRADRPVWVAGGTGCAFVPFELGYCNHLQELMIPVYYWGTRYVGAHSPVRGTEAHYYRIYAGDDDVTVTTEPPLPSSPIVLARRGDWVELVIDNGVDVVFEGDGPFMPVEYLAGRLAGAGTGDPAMYQMVPTDQFLSRYAFVTGVGFTEHYVQVIRAAGAAEIEVDGVVVVGYRTVGAYEIADVLVAEGAHTAESTEPFGILQIGYTNQDASYAYPGGMRVDLLFTP